MSLQAAQAIGGVADKRRPRGQSPLQRRNRRMFWPFVAPALVVYVLFFALPTVASIFISFTKWNGITKMEFVGIRNYTVLMGDALFQRSFYNTLVLLIGGGLVIFTVSFALTLALREMAGRKGARSILFFPNIISAVVLSVFWGFLFQAGGLLDNALAAVGVDNMPQLLLEKPFLVVFVGIMWTAVGYYITILMAGVDQIPPYLYEDAELAGANGFQKFWYITLPMSWDVIATCAVLWTISSLKIFEFIFTFGGATGDLPNSEMWNTALFIYGRTFGGLQPAFQFGYASAAAVVMLITVGVFVALLRRLMRRESVEY